MDKIIDKLKETEHGFKHIIEAGNKILLDQTTNHLELTTNLLNDDSYQVRMLATYLLGQLASNHSNALIILETKVAKDDNWRVQEMLAKAFDSYCKSIGYENTLPIIEKWLSDNNPNNKRAVIEGLRIWTSRTFFKEHPIIAIDLISRNKFDDSEYLRKSIGNALRDISKKHQNFVAAEVSTWNLKDKKLQYIQKLIYK